MITKVAGVLIGILAMVGLHLVVPNPAGADPTRSPGCRSYQSTQKYGVKGVTAYGQTRSFRFCWTGGRVLRSKIYNITGNGYCWSNGIFQDRNCSGPTNLQKVSISSTQRFGRGSTYIYFWFQSRNCVTGPFNFVCAPWNWHGAKYLIKQGGGVVLSDPDV